MHTKATRMRVIFGTDAQKQKSELHGFFCARVCVGVKVTDANHLNKSSVRGIIKEDTISM